jgi:O6-methylguanine-DNA--protein-cysteine methyltransferase
VEPSLTVSVVNAVVSSGPMGALAIYLIVRALPAMMAEFKSTLKEQEERNRQAQVVILELITKGQGESLERLTQSIVGVGERQQKTQDAVLAMDARQQRIYDILDEIRMGFRDVHAVAGGNRGRGASSSSPGKKPASNSGGGSEGAAS